jgi:hypothetical protein
MRTLVPFLAVALLSLTVLTVARAGPDDAAPDVAVLARDVRLLRADVDYLLSREAALTKSAFAAEAAAKNVAAGVQTARTQGFEAAGPNPMSKATLLNTLQAFAAELASKLPKPTQEEDALRSAADAMRRDNPK